jgi:hypothetical protein
VAEFAGPLQGEVKADSNMSPPQRTQRTLPYPFAPPPGAENPIAKSTTHTSSDEIPAHGEDVQYNASGVFGNAVWLMVGPGVETVMSTMDSNSLTVGNRKSD